MPVFHSIRCNACKVEMPISAWQNHACRRFNTPPAEGTPFNPVTEHRSVLVQNLVSAIEHHIQKVIDERQPRADVEEMVATHESRDALHRHLIALLEDL
jgi:hypothetical protein